MENITNLTPFQLLCTLKKNEELAKDSSVIIRYMEHWFPEIVDQGNHYKGKDFMKSIIRTEFPLSDDKYSYFKETRLSADGKYGTVMIRAVSDALNTNGGCYVSYCVYSPSISILDFHLGYMMWSYHTGRLLLSSWNEKCTCDHVSVLTNSYDWNGKLETTQERKCPSGNTCVLTH